jgi:hypothetical protein
MNHTNTAQELAQMGLQTAGAYQQELAAKAAAQKPWAECGIEEKLDRLRNEIMDARRAVRWNNDRHARNEEQLRRLQHHQHGGDGTVVVRIQDLDRNYNECGQPLQGGFDPLA